MTAPPTVVQASSPLFVENLFFKSFPDVLLPNSVPTQDLLARSGESLSCSSKFGVLIVGGQKQLLILRAIDILAAQTTTGGHQKHVELRQVPHIAVEHPSFGSAPVVVGISVGEEFLALDTVRNGVGFVLIFKLEQFLTTPGCKCAPFAELRCSPREGSKVSGIAWNPGENMNNMLAINCDDGFLQLATIKGVNAVEVCSYKDVVRSMCWSPKGKQLVVGKGDGSLCQLKLDLAEAKKIAGPGMGRIPSALFWTTTTQFLVNFVVEGKDIDLMQLDLVKGAPPNYTNFGDAFVSDRVDALAKCSFIPILPWNVIVCTSNTINDLVVIGKGLQSNTENWTIADINDNRRAAITIDTFAVGAALFNGFESPIVFNETETYHGTPVVFVLSQVGALSSFSLVNSKQDAPSLFQKVSSPLPSQMFARQEEVINGKQIIPPSGGGGGDAAPVGFTSSKPFQMPVQLKQELPDSSNKSGPSNLNIFGSLTVTQPTQATLPATTGSGFSFNPSTTMPSAFGISNVGSKAIETTTILPIKTMHGQPAVTSTAQSTSSAPLITSTKPLFDMKSLPTSGLPTLQQVEDLKRIVEEKRAQGGFQDETDDSEPDMDELLLEVEKFQKRLEIFHRRQSETSHKTVQTFNELRKEHEEGVITPLNLMEDFISTLKETKEIQNEEVNGIKESHYTELEYAKAIEERNKDPKYVQLLMAQQLDSGRAKKFAETEKLYQYIQNQTTECERFFKLQNLQPNPLQSASALQGIYTTLANHSQVIRRLAHNVNFLRTQIGLHKTPGIEENRVFEIPTMGHNYYEKKPLLKERPVITIQKSNVLKIKAEKETEEKLTVDDLTAGMSRVKLNKLKQGQYSFVEQKPIRISAKKLEALTKLVSKTEDIDISVADEKNYDPFDISVKNRARSRNLINKLNDQPFSLRSDNKNEENVEIKSILKTPTEPFKLPPSPLSGSVVKPIASKPPPHATFVDDKSKPSFKQPSTSKISPAESAPTLMSMLSPSSTIHKISPTDSKEPSRISPTPASSFGFTMGSITAPSFSSTTSSSPFSTVGSATTTSAGIFGMNLPTSSFNFSSSLFGTPPPSVPSTILKAESGISSLSIDTKPFVGTGGFVLSSIRPATQQTTTTTSAISGLQSSSSIQNPVEPLTTTPAPPSMFTNLQNVPPASSLSRDDASQKGFSFALPTTTTGNKESSRISPVSAFSSSGGFTLGSSTTATTLPPASGIFSSLPTSTLNFSSSFTSSLFGAPPSTSASSSPNTDKSFTGTAATTITPPSSSNITANLAAQQAITLSPSISGNQTASIQKDVKQQQPVIPASTSVFGNLQNAPLATIASSGGTTSLTNLLTQTAGKKEISGILSTPISAGLTLDSAPTTLSPASGIFGTNLPTSTINISSSLFGTPPAPMIPSTLDTQLFSGIGISPLASSTQQTTITSTPAIAGLQTSSFIDKPVQAALTTTTPAPTSIFGNPPTTSSFEWGGGSTPQSGFSFASPTPTTGTASAFGSPSVFGNAATSPFGSAPVFGASTPAISAAPSAFGGTGTSSVFGGGNSSFGSTTFGSAFGSSGSVSPASATSPFGGSSVFGGGGGPPPQVSSSPFGGSTSIFGSGPGTTTNSGGGGGLFSGGGGSTAQSGFSFASPTSPSGAFGSPAPASVFGAASPSIPAFGSAPVFGSTSAFGSPPVGGNPAFGSGGSSSTFGSAFGSSPSSPVSGNIFGGGAAQQSAPSFGALAQAASPSQGFGAFTPAPTSASVFGGQPSAFGGGSTSPPSFGGSAFSSWR